MIKPAFKGAVSPVIQNLSNTNTLNLPQLNSRQALVYFTASKPFTFEDYAARVDKNNLKKHVQYLASEELAGRLPETEGAEKARTYIVDKFKEYGLRPFKPFVGKDYAQHAIFEVFYKTRKKNPKTGLYESDTSKNALTIEGESYRVTNLLGYVPAKTKTDKYVFLTAHYDHLGRNHDSGKIYPGADDNASGVAALLEIARILGRKKLDKNVVFIATSGEETRCLGSKYLARELNLNGFKDKVEIVNLDCLAAKGDFITIEGGGSTKNKKLSHKAIEVAKKLNIPHSIEDHETNQNTDAAAFDREGGFPAISLVWAYEDDFNNRRHLHEPVDTPDKINLDGLEKSTKVALGTVFNLASKI